MNKFITIEGNEGSGKTTIIKHLQKQLEWQGYDVLATREPGGEVIAEQIRKILLDKNNDDMDVITEILLYAAARREHLLKVIKPALKEGKIVICDRFIDSSLVYQGYMHDMEWIVYAVNKIVLDDLMPDLTILLNVKPYIGIKRIEENSDREVNRVDLKAIEFHNKIYEGYQKIAKDNPERIKIIDGKKTIREIVDKIMEMISGG